MAARDTKTDTMMFGETWIGDGAVMLRAAGPVPEGTEIFALIQGVKAGSYQVTKAARVDEGTVVALDCSYYPHLGLPCEIRFAAGDDSADVAPAVVLTSSDQVIQLFGYGELKDGEIRISDGVLRGTAVNNTNAHMQPPLICRINGHVLREVSVTSALARPGGGAMVAFQCEMKATDFNDAGAHYEILALPEMRIVAAKMLAPLQDADLLDARLTALEASMAQLSRRVSYDLAIAGERAEKMHGETLSLLDGFAEYMLSVVFDRMQSGDPEVPASPEEEAAIAAFRALVSERSGRDARSAPGRMVSLNLESVATNDGWHAVEGAGTGGAFMWMKRVGSFYNPHPDTEVDMVSLAVLSVIDEDVVPVIVLFDGQPAEVDILPDDGSLPFRVNAKPAAGARRVHHIQVVANGAFVPNDLGLSPDMRTLSLSLNAIDIAYDLPDA